MASGKAAVPNVAYYNGYKYSSIQRLHQMGNMHGVKRVILFCIMTTVLPTVLIIIPMYLRHSAFADVIYPVAESDVLEIVDGISSVFCNSQSLQMNSTFNAFQLSHTPEVSTKRKHIRLKKSMILPDDTLEYWGFYLLKGATVSLKVCSRYEGSRILVVRGERNLHTCGLLDHNFKKFGAKLDQEHNQVKVYLENVQEIDSTNNEQNESLLQLPVDMNVAVEDVNEIKATRNTKLNSTNDEIYDPLTRERVESSKSSNFSHKGKPNISRNHRKRHAHTDHLEKKNKLQEELDSDSVANEYLQRSKRNIGHTFDRPIQHGGNAQHYNDSDESSTSSFETDLLTCYNGQILLTQNFSPSALCTNVHYLEHGNHMETVHNVISDGYYYYIFYSDNDIYKNDIHAIFDIFKPTFEFANISSNKSCIKNTKCEFPISFWSDETVIVEVPTRDGIGHGDDDDDITLLVSTCHPRMSVYVIFPISIMFLILGCAFL